MIELEPDPPEKTVPFVQLGKIDRHTLFERSQAVLKTFDLLREGKVVDGEPADSFDDFGIEITEEDTHRAESLVREMVAVGKDKMGAIAAGEQTGTMIAVGSILREYSHRVADDAVALREVVKNKLILDTDHRDPKVRLKALELLGKMGDVGAFTERKEVVHTHQTSDDLRAALKDKLARLKEEAIDAEFEEVGEKEVSEVSG